ncbi:MAG: hypothetical protein SRB2_02747 [Desulfobacteraceae bacterium Eth-SRB2]|nr:MAG: hypothetical protein SRB2_02747 [Desulfobacteraceae bacterium Eth-SRB2]
MDSISKQNFIESSTQNLIGYPKCTKFWLPIINSRASHKKTTPEDLLLNPIFRWVFLNNNEKLKAFEKQISILESAMGVHELQEFNNQILKDISTHPIENYAHNRLLSAMTEIRAILRFFEEGYRIALIPIRVGVKTPDFSAKKEMETYLVEVKYIRPPDKLEEYLFRWWQAKKEISKNNPLGLLPHVKFKWSPIESRKELSHTEISSLKGFFLEVYQNPELSLEFVDGRINIKYLPNRKLPAANIPIPIKAECSRANRQGLFSKIISTLDYAVKQISSHSEIRDKIIFIAINLSPDIQFLWNDRFEEELGGICQQYSDKGVEVRVEKVGYL